MSTHIDYRWTARFWETQPTGSSVPGREFYQQPSYGVADARVNLELNDHWRFGVWGKNIFNKQYTNFVIGNGSPVTGFTSNDVSWADPATYGVDVSYKY